MGTVSRDFAKISADKTQRSELRKKAEYDLIRKVATMDLENRDDDEFYTIKNITVTPKMISDPLNNALVLSLADDTDATDGNGWDRTWVAVPHAKYIQINTHSKEAEKRNKIGGKKVRVELKPGIVRSNYAEKGHMMCVRRETLVAFNNRKSDEEKGAMLLAELVADMKKKIKMAKAVVNKDGATIAQYAMSRDPELARRVKQQILENGSFLGVKLRYTADPKTGCDMFGTKAAHYNREFGTVEHPRRMDDTPQDQELRTKRHHKGIMVLNKEAKGVCVSPELRAKSGKAYAEAAYPRAYHHLTDVINMDKDEIPTVGNEEMPLERVWGDMAFCAQHGADDEEKCKSAAPKKYPLSNETRTTAALCRWNTEAERCDPKFGDNEKRNKAAKKIYPDFYDSEMDYIESQMRARIQKRRRGKTAKLDRTADRIQGKGNFDAEFVRLK